TRRSPPKAAQLQTRSEASSRVGSAAAAAKIQITLQKENGGQAVHRGRAFFNADAARAQHTAGLHRGEPFVPKLNRQTGALAQRFREFAHPAGLAAFGAAHIAGFAQADQADLTFPGDPSQGIAVVTALGPE